MKQIHSYLATVSNFGNCDFYSTTGFSIQTLGKQNAISHIIKTIKNSTEEEVYLVCETLDILGYKEFYDVIKNKHLYITTNDYSGFLEMLQNEYPNSNGLITISEPYDSGQIMNNLRLMSLRIKIPISFIYYLEKNILDAFRLLIELLQYKVDETIDEEYIVLNISMLRSDNIFHKFYMEQQNTKSLSDDSIEQLCQCLIDHIHLFYENFGTVLSESNSIIDQKYINDIDTNNIDIRKHIISQYINSRLKLQLIEIRDFISDYTNQNTSFSAWSLFIALVLLPVALFATGFSIVSIGITGAVSSSAIIGISSAYLSLGYSVYNYFKVDNNMAKNQLALYQLCNNLYFTKILEHFYNIISPLMEYNYSIRGNYLYNKESFFMYNSINSTSNYLKNYFVRYNEKNNSKLINFLKNFTINNDSSNEELQIISQKWFEIYKSHEKINIYNQDLLNSKSFIYIETPKYTTPILTATLKNIIDNDDVHRNIIFFSNALNESQSIFMKHELKDKLSIKPTYISYHLGEEDRARNCALYDYTFYDIVMENNVNQSDNTSKIMFFSLFHYKSFYQLYTKIFKQLCSLFQNMHNFFNFVENDITNQYVQEDYVRISTYLPYDWKFLTIEESQSRPYFYISTILSNINSYIIFLNTSKIFCNLANDKDGTYDACINDINEIYSILQPYHTITYNQNKKFYEQYKDFIIHIIDEYLCKQIGYMRTNIVYKFSIANILTRYSIYDDIDKLVHKCGNKKTNTLQNIFCDITSAIFNTSSNSEEQYIFKKILEEIYTIYYYILSISINLDSGILENIKMRYHNLNIGQLYLNIIDQYFNLSIIEFYNGLGHAKVVLQDIYYIIENMISYEYLQDLLDIDENNLKNKYMRCIMDFISNYLNKYHYRPYEQNYSYLIRLYLKYYTAIQTNIEKYNMYTNKDNGFINVEISKNKQINDQINSSPLSNKDYIVTLSLSAPDIANISKNIYNNKTQLKQSLTIKNFASLLSTSVSIIANYLLMCFYSIPDEKKLKEYIELYNYMFFNSNMLNPNTCINNYTICKPIDIQNNITVVDNSHLLFGDKDMDINFLQNSYSLYANIKTDNITIFYDRMYTILTGVGIEGLENILLTQKLYEYEFLKDLSIFSIDKNSLYKIIVDKNDIKHYNFLSTKQDKENFINRYYILSGDFYHMKSSVKKFLKYYYAIGADSAWKYIIQEYKKVEDNNLLTLDIDIDIIKLMLGLRDGKITIDNRGQGPYYDNANIDISVTIITKSFYHVVAYLSQKKIDENLINYKVSPNLLNIKNHNEVVAQTLSDNKIRYSFIDSLHEIAKQNLYSAYITDDYIESMINSNVEIIRNQQPFIGIITLWVLPKNLLGGQ